MYMDHSQFSQVQNPYVGVSVETGLGCGDRNPQWSSEETRDLLAIRGHLDPTFMETKRNKLLWELVSTRMNQIGYNRTPIQCKCKWKNLVTRYKGCETMEEVEMRERAFPFYNEMQIIFNARMQRMMWQEVEGGAISPQMVSKAANSGCSSGNSSPVVDGLKEMMEEFMRQQMELEMQWIKAYEEREERRREREMEWRQRMEALESERLMMISWWREREEERKMREEARAERRDALLTALLDNLTRGAI
ncbi:trihelix transcription factor GT-3b [Salvia miltiorrhiza]|uniref:trihelix transcription factor GT-3b n=1 Tax=Salvia miltiorrhiza TaxID=226208 RepID=UPI0025ABF62E|nr:trihelix transcription factor GT-3b [Salvia miltiorrhiza]